MKNFRRQGKVGEWAICYYNPPYPAFVAEIKETTSNGYELDLPFWFSLWNKNFCSTFETEEEAKKVFRDFVDNRNNYTYEG